MLLIKPGVEPRHLIIAAAAANVASELAISVTVTSGDDGQHMKGSKHYTGEALDFRTNDLTPMNVQAFMRRLQLHLDQDYQLVLEVDHLHVEYDPKDNNGRV